MKNLFEVCQMFFYSFFSIASEDEKLTIGEALHDYSAESMVGNREITVSRITTLANAKVEAKEAELVSWIQQLCCCI